MAATPTTAIELGFDMPHFLLPDSTTGKMVSQDAASGDLGTVVMFICNHCPFVIHVIEEIVRVANDYASEGIGFVAISSNDVSRYPMDGPEPMAKFASHYQFTFPYLYDETQQVARNFDAACTPDFSVFDGAGKCVYRGQLDASRPGNNIPADGSSLRKVLDLLVSGKLVPAEGQMPSIGCGIKWKSE